MVWSTVTKQEYTQFTHEDGTLIRVESSLRDSPCPYVVIPAHVMVLMAIEIFLTVKGRTIEA